MKITTHALDVYSGKPAKGLKVDAYFISEKRNLIKSITLNEDGRSDGPIVDKIKVGNYNGKGVDLNLLSPGMYIYRVGQSSFYFFKM